MLTLLTLTSRSYALGEQASVPQSPIRVMSVFHLRVHVILLTRRYAAVVSAPRGVALSVFLLAVIAVLVMSAVMKVSM